MKVRAFYLLTKTILSFVILLLDQRYGFGADFTTSYDVRYEILPSAETQVTQKLKITNLTNKIFASLYKLTINNLKIYDVEAKDDKEPLKTEITVSGDSTAIKVTFNNQVIGEGKDLKWELKFKTKDIAIKNGRILDINIPKISNLSGINDYNVRLVVAEEFGPEIYINPNPLSQKDGSYAFGFDQVKASAITASFGKNQIFNFKLGYHLTNATNFPKKTEIALPPDILGRQQVYLKNISFKPENVLMDGDGNLIATYILPPRGDLRIELTGYAKILNGEINPLSGGKLNAIPRNLIKNYTKEQKFWETSDPKIIKIAKNLKNTDKNTVENAKAAYDFTIKNLSYQSEKSLSESVERLGALQALSQPNNAICMEFVDLFVSLTRAMGIPAREINGFAYAKNFPLTPVSINLKGGDILHSWAEFYDPNLGWIQVDPTWGSTSGTNYFEKLDTNHFAFAIKGLSSEEPLPAGSYKTPADRFPQIDVSFASDEKKSDDDNYNLRAYSGTSFNPLNLLRGIKTVTILNNGPTTIYKINDSGKNLPPFSYLKIPSEVKNSSVNIYFLDFHGKRNQLKVKVEKGKLKTTSNFSLALLKIPALGLLLYMIFYLSIAHPEYPKRLLRRLSRLLQVRGR
ncbi:transglutaminase domain-containing protein [candidate division WWE3 bacterium]|nr:transglutaminase domain-containing protein [candidate division WWE3 bacterium]